MERDGCHRVRNLLYQKKKRVTWLFAARETRWNSKVIKAICLVPCSFLLRTKKVQHINRVGKCEPTIPIHYSTFKIPRAWVSFESFGMILCKYGTSSTATCKQESRCQSLLWASRDSREVSSSKSQFSPLKNKLGSPSQKTSMLFPKKTSSPADAFVTAAATVETEELNSLIGHTGVSPLTSARLMPRGMFAPWKAFWTKMYLWGKHFKREKPRH